jgi:hypothetical protein
VLGIHNGTSERIAISNFLLESEIQPDDISCAAFLTAAVSPTERQDSTTPIIRTLVIRTANYPARLGPSGNFVENSTKLICPEITGYVVQYSMVKCYGCPELQSGVVERFIRRRNML